MASCSSSSRPDSTPIPDWDEIEFSFLPDATQNPQVQAAVARALAPTRTEASPPRSESSSERASPLSAFSSPVPFFEIKPLKIDPNARGIRSQKEEPHSIVEIQEEELSQEEDADSRVFRKYWEFIGRGNSSLEASKHFDKLPAPQKLPRGTPSSFYTFSKKDDIATAAAAAAPIQQESERRSSEDSLDGVDLDVIESVEGDDDLEELFKQLDPKEGGCLSLGPQTADLNSDDEYDSLTGS